MKLFSVMYEKVLVWSRHRHAPRFLGALSFAESSFFPVPPDVMLAPMSLASPEKAWRYALLTTVASVLGGMFGYLIGVFAFEMVEPLIRESGYWGSYQRAGQWFETWGFWAILLAGFSPVPYKVFTISAGVIGMTFLPFVMASIVGRGARFYLVAGLMKWGGPKMEQTLRVYIDRIGWVLILTVIAIYFLVINGSNA